jgi:hypothetical protein
VNHSGNAKAHLTVQDRAHETHQTIRLAQIAATYGLDHDYKHVVDEIIDILGSQATLKE